MCSPSLFSTALVTLALSLCLSLSAGDEIMNSLDEKSPQSLNQCKHDNKLKIICEACARNSDKHVTVAQCCNDIDVCQTQSRGKRDTSSFPDGDENLDRLYNTLSHLRISGRVGAFLGKRSSWFYPSKRPRNNFLGKRSSGSLSDALPLLDYLEQENDDEKRAQRARPSLGKRYDDEFDDLEEDDYENAKRGRLNFLGKRGRLNFLGKRARLNFLGKRGRLNFLGKRTFDEDDIGAYDMLEDSDVDKRARLNFLGKRGRLNFLGKRARLNFLGKRDMNDDMDALTNADGSFADDEQDGDQR